jgi:hypothetical protein
LIGTGSARVSEWVADGLGGTGGFGDLGKKGETVVSAALVTAGVSSTFITTGATTVCGAATFVGAAGGVSILSKKSSGSVAGGAPPSHSLKSAGSVLGAVSFIA